MVLEADGAIRKWRDLMGATDPLEGSGRLDPRRLRQQHRAQRDPRVSRAPETAAFETGYFFAASDSRLTSAAGDNGPAFGSSSWGSASSSRQAGLLIWWVCDRPLPGDIVVAVVVSFYRRLRP